MARHLIATIVLSLALPACWEEPLTGPEAQQAFIRARSSGDTKLGEGMILLIDGVVQTSNERLPRFDPQTISSIEFVKGPAAQKLYGPSARNGAIHIHTTSATPSP